MATKQIGQVTARLRRYPLTLNFIAGVASRRILALFVASSFKRFVRRMFMMWGVALVMVIALRSAARATSAMRMVSAAPEEGVQQNGDG